MYDFAIVALLALATLKLVDFLTDSVPQLRNMRTLLTFVIRRRSNGAARLLGLQRVRHRDPQRRPWARGSPDSSSPA